MPLGSLAHALHEVPHVAVAVSDTQALPQRWYPALHVKPQAVPSQVAVAFAGGVQGVQLAPQVSTAVLEAQTSPQR